MLIEQLLEQIISEITISPSKQVFFEEEVIFDEFLLIGNNDLTEKKVLKIIENLIYEKYYINPITEKATIDLDEKTFLQQLFKANTSKNRWHSGWKIEHINDNGSIITYKKHQRKFVLPGQYAFASFSSTYPKVEQPIKIFQAKEKLDKNDGFYFAFGETIEEYFPEHIIRFYFNFTPQGAIIWLNYLTVNLNRMKIPFQAKCLKNPRNYNRADAGVLYLNKLHFFEYREFLDSLFKEIKPFLKVNTPLFTLKLTNGIGFAENPPSPSESFGMSRCRLIAEGIWQAFEMKIPENEWTNVVIAYLKDKNYDLEKFYLNPNSRFPYNF